MEQVAEWKEVQQAKEECDKFCEEVTAKLTTALEAQNEECVKAFLAVGTLTAPGFKASPIKSYNAAITKFCNAVSDYTLQQFLDGKTYDRKPFEQALEWSAAHRLALKIWSEKTVGMIDKVKDKLMADPNLKALMALMGEEWSKSLAGKDNSSA